MTRILLALTVLLVLTGVALAVCPLPPRPSALIRQFRKLNPCPATGETDGPCEGWVIDHGLSRCLAGDAADVLYNLFWQRYEDSLKKDALERKLCQQFKRPCPPMGDK